MAQGQSTVSSSSASRLDTLLESWNPESSPCETNIRKKLVWVSSSIVGSVRFLRNCFQMAPKIDLFTQLPRGGLGDKIAPDLRRVHSSSWHVQGSLSFVFQSSVRSPESTHPKRMAFTGPDFYAFMAACIFFSHFFGSDVLELLEQLTAKDSTPFSPMFAHKLLYHHNLVQFALASSAGLCFLVCMSVNIVIHSSGASRYLWITFWYLWNYDNYRYNLCFISKLLSLKR